jgi:hypothetical protein
MRMLQSVTLSYCCVQDQSGEMSEAGGSTAGEEESGKKTGLLEAIRLPLVSVFPRSKLKSTKVTFPTCHFISVCHKNRVLPTQGCVPGRLIFSLLSLFWKNTNTREI